MAGCTVTLTANAGVLIRLGASTVLVDALHDGKLPGYSALTPARWDALRGMLTPAGPSAMLFTHCHPDHFSPALARQVMALWPNTPALLPGALPGAFRLNGAEGKLALDPLTIRFVRLPHEGAQYADVVHYGFLLEQDGFRVLLPGDCAVCEGALADFAARYGPVDCAVMAFPWLTLRRGRDFVARHIRPQYLLVDHLPFREDDENGWRAAAESAVPLMDAPDIRLLTEPFQTEYMD